ncbi:hypothetical protein BS50DRAFT_576044 [Corynespora cassiicola Philippines]|uniref:Uncharacterized protein n=1 Tax=Corynespora cassiicola Philippines TaxID=1448308 RepID=A0A2T2NGP9_CORCC|nr:hypothetical protein BS50DRAFT_576044 [Corynespora cassiicola Philippines]
MSSSYSDFIKRSTSAVVAAMHSHPQQSTKYSDLRSSATSDRSDDISTQPNEHELDSPLCETQSRYAIIPYVINFLLAVGLTVLVGFIFRPFPPHGPKMKTLSCGSSPAEARSNGCTYDVLGNIWVPTPCLDTENLADFKRMAEWQAYDSANATNRLTEQEMSEYIIPDGYWTPVREHMIHCALMWRRLHKGFEKDARLLDKHVLEYHHTEHCSLTLMEHLDMPTSFLDEIRTRTEAGYSKCQVPV